ncbi:MAG: hypothetical protein V4752_11450, partial [Pantoea dispersa]
HVITRRRSSQITGTLAVVRDNVSKISVHNSRTSGKSVNAKIFPHYFSISTILKFQTVRPE